MEDNPDDRFALRWALKKANVTVPVDVAEDGREAVEYLTRSNPRPDLVFLDLKLPYVMGFEVLSFIRSEPNLADLDVVILSGSDEDRDHRRAQELGVTGYLVKPASPESLVQILAPLELID